MFPCLLLNDAWTDYRPNFYNHLSTTVWRHFDSLFFLWLKELFSWLQHSLPRIYNSSVNLSCIIMLTGGLKQRWEMNFVFSVFYDLLSGSLNQYAKLILHKKLLYNIKYFEGQKVLQFGWPATFLHFTDINFCRWLIMRQYTGINFRNQHILIKFADKKFRGNGQKTRKPRNFLSAKVSSL